MTIQEVTQIVDLFKSKAPAPYYLESPKLNMGCMKYSGISLFTGSGDKDEKVASLDIRGIDGEICTVYLLIGWNRYEFMENPDLCLELIDRFVPNLHIQPKIDQPARATAIA